MPDEAHVTQWRVRANTLIADSSRIRDALAGEVRQFRRIAYEYLSAMHHYAMTSAREEEREILLELGRRAGRRTTTFSQRNEVADSQMRTEESLHLINRQIFWCQVTIGIGKLAEAGLGVYAWFPKVNQGLEGAKLVIDGLKALQPVGAEIVAAATGGSSRATPWNAAIASGQIIAVLLRMDDDFKAMGTSVWNHLATIRRAKNMTDAWTAAAAIAQLLKTALDNLKSFINLVENYNREAYKLISPNRSGMATAVGGLATFLGIFRDLLEAGKAFAAAYEAHLEMKVALEGMERQIAEGRQFIGSAPRARLRLPSFRELSRENIDQMLTKNATDFNAARVMADAARQEAARIQSDINAAATFRREQTTRLRSVTQRTKPHLDTADEYLGRFALLIVDMARVADRQGVNRRESDIAAATEFVNRLTRERDLLRGTCQEFQFDLPVR